MPIAHVKADVAAAAEKARQGHAELQSLRPEIDQAISRVQAATQGTTRAEPSQAIASWQQAKVELDQAATAIMSGADHADQYAARI